MKAQGSEGPEDLTVQAVSFQSPYHRDARLNDLKKVDTAPWWNSRHRMGQVLEGDRE
jgi:hypothetical protein